MAPALLGIRLLDGSYWTLLVELTFYGLITLAIAFGIIQKHELMRNLATLWASLSAIAAITLRLTGLDEPLSKLISASIIEYAPLFATGMIALHMRNDREFDWRILVTISSALLASLALNEPWKLVPLISVILIFTAATQFRSVPILNTRPLQFLGTISYSWYLVHQNIGYAIIHWAPSRPLRIAIATALTLFLGWALHATIEKHVSPRIRRSLSLQVSP